MLMRKVMLKAASLVVLQSPASCFLFSISASKISHLLNFAKCEKVWPSGFHIAVWMEGECAETVTDKLALALGCLTYGGEGGAFQHTHFSGH